MMAERWRQIETLFVQAIERPDSERRAFLDRVCAGDEELRRELESLLASDTPDELLVELPAAGANLSAGDRIGPYRIVREIGSGGMGTVYEAKRAADDASSAVAIKVIRRGMDSQLMLKRFRQEWHILASLDHPNIVRLLDSGTSEDGQPYFVTDFVAGVPISSYCRSFARSVREKVTVFLEVCYAVQAAHRKSIVHRDLKPANILVTNDGRPRLLDFGIAKWLDPLEAPITMAQTLMGLRMMTPEYASPEQVRGDAITDRSDIYALGAILFELLTGQKAHQFRGRTAIELQRVICDTEPARPSAVIPDDCDSSIEVRRELERGLDHIVIKAMQKDAMRRYASVDHLAADLRNYLNDLPIAARSEDLPATSTTSPGQPVATLAIEPFVNIGEKEYEYFAQGLCEELAVALARLPGLRVIGQTSMLTLLREQPDARAIIAQTGATVILGGSVRRSGGLLRVIARLMRASDSSSLWSQRFESELKDVFALQDEITQAIVTALSVSMPANMPAGIRGPVDAYDLYLNGRYHWHRRTEKAIETSRLCFEQAIALHPDYGPAYAGLADTLMVSAMNGNLAVIPRARQAALHAVQLAPEHAEAHSSLAFLLSLFEWSWRRAEDCFRRAIELNRGIALPPYLYAITNLAPRAHWEEAHKQMRRALMLDPLCAPVVRDHGIIYYLERDYDRAIECLNRARSIDPDFQGSLYWLGRVYESVGDLNKAIDLYDARYQTSGNQRARVFRARGRALAGIRAEAEALLIEVDSPTDRALLHLSLGNISQALAHLDEGMAQRDPFLYTLGVDPGYDPLRHLPEFARMLQKMFPTS